MTDVRTPRRAADPRIRAMIQTGNTWEVLLQLSGGMLYAGDDANPRPLPRITLVDHKRSVEYALQSAHRRGVQQVGNALYFAFYADRFKAEPGSIAVPGDDLWWLVSPGDTVLLSDKVTHHYTGVFDVDREAERVSFLDQWPDRFFLREGLNVAGVAARMVGTAPLSISREEFRRVAVGLVTLDTPALLEDYLAQHPERAGHAGLDLACGLALLDAEKERFARVAAPYLRRALVLAEAGGDQARAGMAAGKLLVALTVAGYEMTQAGEPMAARPFQDDMRWLTASRPREAIVAGLDAGDLCHMGNAAGNAGDLPVALELFDRAVTADPAYEQAYWLRAIARDQAQEPERVAADAAEALRLNIARVEALEAEREALDPRDRHGRDSIDNRIASMKDRRLQEYVLAFRGHFALERWDEARAAGEALVALAPGHAEGYKRLAALEHRLGHLEAARARLGAAIEREKSHEARQALERALAEMNA